MEGRVWVTVLRFLPLDQCASGRFAFSDRVILMVMLWAVLHDRPMAWACQSDNWPDWARPRRLPHASTISRRSRTSTVTAVSSGVEAEPACARGALLMTLTVTVTLALSVPPFPSEMT